MAYIYAYMYAPIMCIHLLVRTENKVSMRFSNHDNSPTEVAAMHNAFE